ncbi:MAG: hypothetical protein U0807_05805 [Candidatus Binatia bacterium]
MTLRAAAATLHLALLVAATPVGGAPRPAPTAAVQGYDSALLRQMAEAQRTLGEQVQGISDRVDAITERLAERKDDTAGVEQEVKALREEVKGLYVEDSTLKQQIDSLREDVQTVNSNVSGFRTFSGFFIALMLAGLVVIFVLTVRR